MVASDGSWSCNQPSPVEMNAKAKITLIVAMCKLASCLCISQAIVQQHTVWRRSGQQAFGDVMHVSWWQATAGGRVSGHMAFSSANRHFQAPGFAVQKGVAASGVQRHR